MAYNHGREERKWRIWKAAEEKLMRECGVDESTLEQLYIYDRAEFNSNRRFYRRLQEVGTYLDEVAQSEQALEISTVETLLGDIDNDEAVQGFADCGQAYPAIYFTENAGIFYKGDCFYCSFNNRCYLCKDGSSA